VGLCTPSVHLRHRYIRCFQTHADLLPRMATTARQNGKPNNAPQYKFFDNLMYHQQEQYSPRHLRKPFVDIILGIISSCVLHPPFAYAFTILWVHPLSPIRSSTFSIRMNGCYPTARNERHRLINAALSSLTLCLHSSRHLLNARPDD